MNTSIRQNVAGYLSFFLTTNAKGQKIKGTRLLKVARSGKYTHPLEKASIYIHIFKKIDRLPDFRATLMFTRAVGWRDKWQKFLISAIGIFGIW